MAAGTTEKKLKLTVVTPERAVLDSGADMVILPLFDGELGVLPGRAALVGQLGPGELRFTAGGDTIRYFVDGGFAQVNADSVSVLTAFARKVSDIKPDDLTREKSKAEAMPESNAVEAASKRRAIARSAAMNRVVEKTSGPAAAH